MLKASASSTVVEITNNFILIEDEQILLGQDARE